MMNPLHRFTLAVVARQRGVLDIGRALISCSAPRIAQRECRGRHASSKASQERRKAKALVRARRERNDALNEILDPGKWAGLERTLTKGLRELDSSPERKQRGSQLRKPLVEQQVEGLSRFSSSIHPYIFILAIRSTVTQPMVWWTLSYRERHLISHMAWRR